MRSAGVLPLGPLLLAVLLATTGCDDDPVDPVDREAPAVPRGLTSVTGDEEVELLWYPNQEFDLSGYRVYRTDEPQGRYRRIAWVPARRGVYRESYLDRGLRNGQTYYYAVSAVDYAGNESELSWEDLFDTPRPEGRDVRLRNYNDTIRDCAYDFSAERVTDFDDLAADIAYTWDEQNGGWMIGLDDPSTGYFTELQDAGFAEMDDVSWAPPDGWSYLAAVPLAEGHVYVAWTRNDHYAKFRVVRIEPGEVVFDWAYQTARGNQELSAPGEIQPAGARPPERPEHPDRARGRLATRGRTGGH